MLSVQCFNKPIFFTGRFKTFQKKEVHYKELTEGDVCILSAGIASGGVSGLGSFAGLATLPSMGASGAIALGVFGGAIMPGASTAIVVSDIRKVSYRNVSVPMTLEEEMAAMTPLEKAHFQIQQALDNWSKLRQEQKNTIQKLTDDLGSGEQELKALEKETCPKGIDATEFHSRLKMRFKAKESSVQQQSELLETAQKVFKVLDAEIQKREQTLFEAQEKLNMMQRQKSVIALHKQLEKIKGESEKNDSTSNRKETEQLALEMEKQQIEIQALMASLQTEMDVETVLKSVSETKD